MARMHGVVLSLSLLVVAVAGSVFAPDRTSASVRADDALPPRPNVVMLMVDDLDAGSTRTALQHGLLPNLDRYVFRGGTTFTESFVTLSLCAPSRATYLSGLYPHNHGVVRNSGVSGGFSRFDDRSTVATWLHDAGYRTAHVGKYLNGYADGTYVPPGWDDWQALVDPSTYCMYGYTVSNNGHPVTYGTADEDYQTDVLSAIAGRFVESTESGDARPFFLSIAPLAPHLESACNPDGVRAAPRHLGSVALDLPAPPSLNEADMSDKPAWMRRLPLRDESYLRTLYDERLAALRAVDDLVGRLAEALERNGALERTAFVFTSDNGYLLGQHRWQTKVLVYEESIRVPLAIHLPGGGMPPVATGMALNDDLAPTIAALARVVPPQPVDGRSLLPLLRGEASPWRRMFLVEYPPTGERGIPPFYAVRAEGSAGRRGVVLSQTLSFDGQRVRARELYDLETDPFQLDGRADDPASVLGRSRRSLERHLQALATCPRAPSTQPGGSGGCPAREN